MLDHPSLVVLNVTYMIKIRSVLFSLCILVVQLSATMGQTGQKPNIVFVLADDLGYSDINSFDPLHRQFYETPHIDKLATQGMKFTRAYTNAANCSPSRAAMLSGQYYPRQPIYHVGDPHQGAMIPAPNLHSLPLEKITIAEALKQGGYHTGFIGKWHIGTPPDTGPRQQGFDLNVGGYNAGNPGDWEGGYFHPNNNPYINDSIPVAKRFDRLTHCDYFQCVKLRLSDRVLLEEMRFNTRDKKVFVRCSVMLMVDKGYSYEVISDSMGIIPVTFWFGRIDV